MEGKFKIGSKNDFIQQMMAVIEEYRVEESRLTALQDAGTVNFGCWFVYGLGHQYSYRWLFGLDKGRKESPKELRYCHMYGAWKDDTPVREYKYHLQALKKDLAKIREFLGNPGVGPGWSCNNPPKEESAGA